MVIVGQTTGPAGAYVYVDAPDGVSVEHTPGQTAVGIATAVIVGFWNTVTVRVAEAVQPA